MEEEQAPPGGEDSRENRAALISRRLAEGREHLERMQTKSIADFNRDLRDLQSQVELVKWIEEQQVAWALERECLQSEISKLRSEVEQLRAVSTSLVCDNDPGSEEIDLKALTGHGCISASRKALAPVTPEAVRARTPSVKLGIGKENIYSDQKSAEEIQRLRLEVEHWKQKTNRLSKEYKGLKSQYNYLQTRLGSKGDAGHLMLNPGHVQAALEGISEKPSKIPRRSPGETPTQGGDASSPNSISSDLNGPSTPGILPRAVAEVVTGSTTSTPGSRDPQAKVKAEPESFKAMIHIPLSKNKTDRGLDALFEEIPTAKNKSAGGLDAGPEGKAHQAVDNSGTPTAMAGNKKRPLDPSGKPPFKFVESVRKKTERENLQGAACKLCKKFYDAVLDGNAEGAAEFRCNHLEQSRHRFRDLPPATPEGFWNIGFDSEF